MNIEVEPEIEQNNESDSLFNVWKPNPNRKDQFGFDSAFFENYSVQNVSVDLSESLKSQMISHSNKSAINPQQNSHNADTISLTDMLKTNYCSHKGVGSSVGNITAFGKITNAERQNHNDRFDIQDDGLQNVSNRKLQNKANAKRARERKKQEWQQMQEMIDELQIENRTLKQNLESRGKSVSDNRNPEEGNKNKWRFCRRCKKDLYKYKESEGDQDSSSQLQEQLTIFQKYDEHCKEGFKHQKKQYQLANQYRRLIYHNEEKKGSSSKNFFRSSTTQKNKMKRSIKDFESWVENQKHKQQELERQYLSYQKEHGNIDQEVRVFNQMNSKNRSCQYSNVSNKSSQMQIEFQQFDLSQTVKNQDRRNNKIFQNSQIKNQNVIKGKDKKKDRKWVGKMWLGLSLIMLAIGIQLHGLEGSGQKSIRICDKQAKRWAADFENPQRGQLRIRMKTKIPTVQIENQKQTQNLKWKEKEKWKSNFQKIKSKQLKYSHNSNENLNYQGQQTNEDFDSNNINSLIQNISFESEQSYTRAILEQQEQQEIKFNKDFLYSIQAEFDDIGRYI